MSQRYHSTKPHIPIQSVVGEPESCSFYFIHRKPITQPATPTATTFIQSSILLYSDHHSLLTASRLQLIFCTG